MSKADPYDRDCEPLGLEIEIDPTLLEEALASIERRSDANPDAPVAVDVGPEGGGPQEALGAEREERRQLEARLAELEDQLEAAREESAEAIARNGDLDHQLREARLGLATAHQDFERYRARVRKDTEEAERRAEERALRALLEIFDNIERARFHGEQDPARVLGGLQMIVEQFRRQLLRVGFERVPAARGSAFDPEIHEAVAHVPEDDVPEGAIVEEVSAGFRLRGRLFRPTRVTVAQRLDFGGQ